MDEFELSHDLIVMTSALVTVALGYLSYRLASPVASIFFRWSRWITMAFFFALLMVLAEVPRSFPVLVATGFLIYALVETGYNWLLIKAVSRSELPLFPRFVVNREGSEWPSSKFFIDLNNWLRTNGFSKKQDLKAKLEEIEVLRCRVYESADLLTRLQVIFFPGRSGNMAVSCVFSSKAKNGDRLITDNFHLPFGGCYPLNWHLERTPWRRSPKRLLRRHLKRMREFHGAFAEWSSDPVDDINQQQFTLEKTNTEMGYLHARSEYEEHGKLTWEGRYRFWKELWLISYLGRAVQR